MKRKNCNIFSRVHFIHSLYSCHDTRDLYILNSEVENGSF